MSFLCLHAASSVITVRVQSVSGCQTCTFGRVLLSCQGSRPASRELKPCITVVVAVVALATTAGDSVHHLDLLLGRGSFTLVSTERSDHPALKITFIPYFPHTHLMSSLRPAVYDSTTKGGCFSPLASLRGPPHVEDAEWQSE